jgi:hypothetical protein
VHSFRFRLRAGVSGAAVCIPPAFPAPALLRATFYEFKRTPVTMINTMTLPSAGAVPVVSIETIPGI